MKQVNQGTYRHLIKDLQRLKDRVLIERQLIECIRSVEAQIYKIDYRKRFNEILIKKLENHLKSLFLNLPHAFENHSRADICKNLYDLIETFIKTDATENLFDELLNTFTSNLSHMKRNHSKSSKIRYRNISSDATVSSMSSVQST